MDFNSAPDIGLVKALKRPGIPDGTAHEFGAGSGRNSRRMAQYYPGRTVGYDLNLDLLELAGEKARGGGAKVKYLHKDALGVEIPPDSAAVLGFGTPIYHPKSIAIKFFRRAWGWLKRGGILHAEFATPDDFTKDSQFFIYTCLPFPEDGYKNSWSHYCGYRCVESHPGVLGTSFWTEHEIWEMFASIGTFKKVHTQLDEWVQQVCEEGPSGDEILVPQKRSFIRVTLQKI